MIYADTSCLLKVLRPEPLSKAVWGAINKEDAVVISTLGELETLVQLKAFWTGGSLVRNEWRQAEARFSVLRNQPPFEFCASIEIQATCTVAPWIACIWRRWRS